MNFNFIDERLDFYIIGTVIDNSLSNFKVISKSSSIRGNIYRGRISNKLKNKNAAFIDIGENKNAYLESDTLVEYSEGEDIIVQVIKDELGTKGPKVSDKYEIKSDNLVLSTDFRGVKFSKNISNKKFIENFNALDFKNYGILFRTSSEKESYDKLNSEIVYLDSIFKSIEKERYFKPTPKILYRNDKIIEILNNLENTITITNSENIYDKYNKEFIIKLDPNFDIEKNEIIFEIKKLFSKRALENKAELVFDNTEALTVIDINSKGFSEKGKDLNLVIIDALLFQIKNRNIRGIIIVDLLNYEKDRRLNYKKVLDEINYKSKDYDRNLNIIDITKLGLLEMTRKMDDNSVVLSGYSYDEIFKR